MYHPTHFTDGTTAQAIKRTIHHAHVDMTNLQTHSHPCNFNTQPVVYGYKCIHDVNTRNANWYVILRIH